MTFVSWLEANRDGAEYLVAVDGSMSADDLIIASGLPVMDMGGFSGTDPVPTLAQFEKLVAAGKVRYVLVGGGGFGGDVASAAGGSGPTAGTGGGTAGGGSARSRSRHCGRRHCGRRRHQWRCSGRRGQVRLDRGQRGRVGRGQRDGRTHLQVGRRGQRHVVRGAGGRRDQGTGIVVSGASARV
jgi:hypothetical protein